MALDKKKVLVNFIQDRSGSMSGVWTETLSGFKKFVEDLAEGEKDGVEYLFSLTTFDTLVETPLIAVPLSKVDKNILSLHGPRGGTALYDAVGTTIKNTEDNRHGADKIIVVIVTDGHENSSREWTKDSLHVSIEAKLTAGDWTFTYLGTQPETWDDASAVGISSGSSVNYTGTMAHAAYATVADSVNAISASATMGTRSLMRDFSKVETRRAAGMSLREDAKPTPPPVKPRTPVRPVTHKPDTRRWK
jgi:uncharacterized protein YegL